jgi:hypothetical protein
MIIILCLYLVALWAVFSKDFEIGGVNTTVAQLQAQLDSAKLHEWVATSSS